MKVFPQNALHESWQKCRLGDVLTLINGRAYSKHEERESGTPVLRIQNLSGGDRWFYSDLNLPASKYCENGDLLFAWSATFGPYIFDGPKSIYHYHIWKVECGPLLDKHFAFYLLQEITEAVKSAGRGISMLHMTKSGMEDWQVNIPPLKEQKWIAAILDQADELRRKRQRALDRLNQLGQAIFMEMFGDPIENPMQWPRVRFGDLLDQIESGWSPVCEDRAAAAGEWGVLKLGAVTWGDFDESQNKAMTEGALPRPEIEVRPGDVLFSRKNTHDLVAACAYVFEVRPRLMLPDLVFRFKLLGSSEMEPIYLWSLLSNTRKRAQIQRLAGGAAGSMPNISKSKLLEELIEFPPIDRQRSFAEKIRALRKTKSGVLLSAEKIESLFSSLQHRAFRGELSTICLKEAAA